MLLEHCYITCKFDCSVVLISWSPQYFAVYDCYQPPIPVLIPVLILMWMITGCWYYDAAI